MKFWCANFEHPECLCHGMAGGFWLMHYQYTDDDEGNRRNRIAVNYRRLMDVSEGDMLVAYLPTNTFYATGEVVAPRRTATGADTIDTIEDYLQRHESYDAGYIYFDNSVAYENHTDSWRHPGPEWRSAYPVRIDVEGWENYVETGVEARVVNEITLPQRQIAIFELTKQQFNRIVARLQTA